jgi:hypothetical protein
MVDRAVFSRRRLGSGRRRREGDGRAGRYSQQAANKPPTEVRRTGRGEDEPRNTVRFSAMTGVSFRGAVYRASPISAWCARCAGQPLPDEVEAVFVPE